MKTLNYIKLNESGVANVVSALHQLLADFQVYYTNLRGFHWNIKGHGFFVLHEKFESMYDDAAEKVDEIAERTYGFLIGEERKIIELANEAGDDVTADLMTGYLKEQEKMVWMLVAFSTKGCTDK